MLCKPGFFGGKTLPEIELSDNLLRTLAEESVNRSLTVPGVQKKLSMHLTTGEKPRLTVVGYPAGYILKPQTGEYQCLPESEDMVMDIAEMMGVATVPHGLMVSGNGYLYVAKRIDRIVVNSMNSAALAMEDFCQLSERLTADKYKSSYERCAAVIRHFSERPGIDMSEFFLRLVVCFLTGNSDMHLKNFSLIENAPGSRQFQLSAAYDLLPVNILIPEDKDETALTLCGKRSNIRRRDFISFALSAGIPQRAAEKMIDSCLKRIPKAEKICDESFLNHDMKLRFKALMQERAGRISE